MTTAEFEPDTHEVLQEEPYTMPVTGSVTITGPVRTQALPRKGAGTLTKTLTTTEGQVLTADHRRGRTVLLGDADFLVAFSQASCQADTSMAAWPANVALVLTGTTEVWAKAATGTVSLSVLIERWAEG